MSVELMLNLVEPSVLAADLERARATRAPATFDDNETFWALPGSNKAYRRPKRYKTFDDLGWRSDRYMRDLDWIIRIILPHTLWADGNVSLAGESLFRFTASFHWRDFFNEMGLRHCLIMGPQNARWHLHLYNNINFELLRPIYEQYCPTPKAERHQTYIPEYELRHPPRYLQTFEDVQTYVGIFAAILEEAVASNSMVYGYMNP